MTQPGEPYDEDLVRFEAVCERYRADGPVDDERSNSVVSVFEAGFPCCPEHQQGYVRGWCSPCRKLAYEIWQEPDR